MSSNYNMNFHLKVNKQMESETERLFWKKVLVASVNELADLESRSSVLRAGCHDVIVSDTTESFDFKDGIETNFFWMTEQQLTVYYEDFIKAVGMRIYRFTKDKNVDIKLAVHVWWDDREPDAIVEKTLEDMADEAIVDMLQETHDEVSNQPSSGPKNIYGLRYANCSPNDRHAVDKTYAILTESWLERLQCEFHGREPNDWVRHNRKIMLHSSILLRTMSRTFLCSRPFCILANAVRRPWRCERLISSVVIRTDARTTTVFPTTFAPLVRRRRSRKRNDDRHGSLMETTSSIFAHKQHRRAFCLPVFFIDHLKMKDNHARKDGFHTKRFRKHHVGVGP